MKQRRNSGSFVVTKALEILTVLALATTLTMSCKKDSTAPTGPPQITSCSSWSWNGQSWSTTCCQMGASSCDQTSSQNGASGSFSITCSQGCVRTVTAH